MSVQIKKDGWEISGDSLEDLETGIAAVQRVLSGGSVAGKRRPGRPPNKSAKGDEVALQRLESRKKKTLAYLKAIQGSPEGITASNLVTTTGIKNKSAIGSAAIQVNRTLDEAGFKHSVVYYWEKKAGHEKTWFPKPRIEEALKAIESLET